MAETSSAYALPVSQVLDAYKMPDGSLRLIVQETATRVTHEVRLSAPHAWTGEHDEWACARCGAWCDHHVPCRNHPICGLARSEEVGDRAIPTRQVAAGHAAPEGRTTPDPDGSPRPTSSHGKPEQAPAPGEGGVAHAAY